MHPYWGQDLWGFFVVLFSRLFSFHRGEMAIDEMQILVLGLIGVTASLVGSLLIYRRMTMLANSISHTVLLGIVITHLLGIKNLLISALCTSFLTTGTTNFFTKVLRVPKDASIGLIFTTFLALGITLVTIFTRNAHIGAELILGNIDLLQKEDVVAAFWVAIATVAVVIVFYRPLVISTFDPAFGASLKISVKKYDQLIMLITSLAVISSFRIVGVALVLALLVLPPMIARLFTNRLRTMFIGSMLVNLCVAIVSVALTRAYLSVYDVALSTGGMMVSLLFMTYISAMLLKRKRYGKRYRDSRKHGIDWDASARRGSEEPCKL